MTQWTREDPLPQAMQGCWVDADDPAGTLAIEGAEIVYLGQAVAHDHKWIDHCDGALTVRLGVGDERDEDSFQRASITGLVISPDGELFAYNVKFASKFVRAAKP